MSTEDRPWPETASEGLKLAAASSNFGKRKNGTTCSAPQGTCSLTIAGKIWHTQRSAFRPTAGLGSYSKRKGLEQARQATKAREQEMKAEKEGERNKRVQAIKDRRKAKEEKERYEKMAEKTHRKIVERRKRREKRNKLLKSGK